jgi:hypothetical protein
MQHQIESIVSPVAQVLERSAAASPAPAVFTTPSSSHDPVFSFGASSSISLEAQDQMDQVLHYYMQLQQQMSPHNSDAEVQRGMIVCYGRKVEKAAIFATVRWTFTHSLSVLMTICTY